MTKKIESKIVGFSVQTNVAAPPPQPEAAKVIHMHEQIERPPTLDGRTYKVKSPAIESALYITINDIVLNEGTEHELRRPYEIFINTRDTKSYQWIVALTRLMSAVFRKGGDVTFLVDEMRSIFDPQGGYYVPGGRYMPSFIAEIGDVIERHLRHIGLVSKPEVQVVTKREVTTDDLKNATFCDKCHEKSLVVMDGCQTCLSCGYSKCG